MKVAVAGLLICACAARLPATARVSQGRRVVAPQASPIAYRNYLLARLAFERDDMEHAAAYLREALLSDPHSAFLHARLGEALARAGAVDDARREAMLALHLEPGLAEAEDVMREIATRPEAP